MICLGNKNIFPKIEFLKIFKMTDKILENKQRMDLLFKVTESVNNVIELNNEELDKNNFEQMAEILDSIQHSLNTQIKINYPDLDKNSLSIYGIFSTIMNGYNMSFTKDEFEKIKNYNS